MNSRNQIRAAAFRMLSTLAFGGGIAALIIVLGTRDLESYDHSFFSLDRGTAFRAVHVLGHPVFTTAVGLGVRLPLHGSLGASPPAALAPYLPVPLTYWLLITFSIGAAVMVARHALEPTCGRVISWLSMVLLFCSVPMVNYTIYDDWPETAVTYCAFVGCVFAPHALLTLLDSRRSSSALAGVSVAGVVWGLVGVSHPGYWSLLAGALVLTAALALRRSEYPFRTRLAVVAALATVSLVAVGLQLPDIVREITVARAFSGVMRRFVQGPQGTLMSANLFPFGQIGARMPFTYLMLAFVSLAIGLTATDVRARRLTIGTALISIVLGVAAAHVSPGSAAFAPSNTWALRDPAGVFAVFAAACAAGAVRRSGITHVAGAAPAMAALAIAGLQGPMYAAALVSKEFQGWGHDQPWTQDMSAPQERTVLRGLAISRVPPGERLALWPGLGDKMRNERRSSMDFADAGYQLVTVWMKERTMRGLIEPNELLFDQTTDLSPQVLCNGDAVRFLQLRYLLLPPDVECDPWTRLPGELVDGWLQVGVARERDDRVRALPAQSLSERVVHQPALSAGSALPSLLIPLSGTSLTVGTNSVVVRLGNASIASGRALVLPVAFDSAWRVSAGRTQNVGGLLALTDVDQRDVTVDFVPDAVAVLRALSMTVAQLLAVVGLLGLAWVDSDPHQKRLVRGGPVAD